MPRHLQRRVFFKAFRVSSVVIGLEDTSGVSRTDATNPSPDLDQAQTATEAAGVSSTLRKLNVAIENDRL